VHLPVHNQRVDHIATIVYSHIALQLHRASLPIDLDDTDVRPKRTCAVGGFEAAGGLQPGFEASGDATLELPVEVVDVLRPLKEADSLGWRTTSGTESG
jgi:hypothetical protein